MPRGQPADRAQLAEIYRLYDVERMTFPKIAVRFGISATAAKQAAKRWRELSGIDAGDPGTREGVTIECKNAARDAEIVRLFHAEGITRRQIAVRLSVTRSVVANVLYLHGRRAGLPKRAQTAWNAGKEVKDGPRCRCGLLLPCESCIPTAAELGRARLSPVITEGPE